MFLKKEVVLVLVNRSEPQLCVIAIVKFSNRFVQNLFNVDKETCVDSRKLCFQYVLRRLAQHCIVLKFPAQDTQVV